MNPQELAKLTLATSTMTDREIIESMYVTVLQMNGSLKSHAVQLKILWGLAGGVGTALLSMLGLHMIP